MLTIMTVFTQWLGRKNGFFESVRLLCYVSCSFTGSCFQSLMISFLIQKMFL